MDDEALAVRVAGGVGGVADEHHESSDGIWIKFAKKASGIPSVTYKEVLPIALAHGWIDGQVKRIDDDWYRQRWTPRRARSVWSKINRAAAEAMIERGEMKPAGLREVERAKADGRWERAYDSPKTARSRTTCAPRSMPTRPPRSSSPGSTRSTATRSCTGSRARRSPRRARGGSSKFVAMCSRGETVHPRRDAR